MQTTQSLREVLATNRDLRHKVQQAAAQAAYQVIKEAGITVTAADVADARGDIAAMTIPASELGIPPTAMCGGAGCLDSLRGRIS
jgi:hypothetical protein